MTSDQFLISVSFGRSKIEETTPRYQWDNQHRGPEAFVIFQYTYSGCGAFTFGGRTHAVPAGHAFIATVPEASRYYYADDSRESWKFSWINFYGAFAVQLWSSLRERSGPVVALPALVANRLERLILNIDHRRWKDPYDASAAAYRFLLEVTRHQDRGRVHVDPIDRSMAHLRGHYQEAVRIKEVAALAGMSREHFTRVFFKRMGKSPGAFVREIRLEAAARLLKTTAMPIKEIAFRSGFANSTKLGIFFRRRYRCSLSVFREKS